MAHDDGNAAGDPLTRWQRFRLVLKVIELRLRFVALLVATGLVFAYWDTIWNHVDKWQRPPGTSHARELDVEHYCPMHPAVVMDQPGLCPICGMPLSRRQAGASASLPPGVLARVVLSPERVVQAGVRVASVRYAPLVQTVSTVGIVELDERRVRRISSRIPGMSRVESLAVNVTGMPIKAGDALATIYNASLYQAVQELLLAHRAAARAPGSGNAATRSAAGTGTELVRASEEKLRLWGLTDSQIDEIVRSGRADYRLPIVSPIDGIVLAKRVVEGQYLNEGEEMFEVADLSQLWIKARVYEDSMAEVAAGQEVEARVAAYPGETFEGTVALVDPVLDPRTRTVGVRIDVPNRDGRLRPGMYASVSLNTPVARTRGYLAQRGPRAQAPVALASLTPELQRVCLVTNLELGTMGEPVEIEVEGQKVWLCCAACEEKIMADPKLILARLQPAPADEVLSVLESAVIQTGRRSVVYVETEPGVFEGREVVLGRRAGGMYPVIDGLLPGERVAAAGAFLVDAENRLATGGSLALSNRDEPGETSAKPHDH